MSSVVISGDTSGAITLAAPAVAGTNTITLPASTGTVLTTGSPQSGGVIQMINVTKTDVFTTTSTSFADVTGLTATITPKFSTSKILVMVSFCMSANSGAGYPFARVLRGSTAIYVGDAASNRTPALSNAVGYNSDNAYIVPISAQFIDSPATTSATTYKVQALQTAGNTTRIGATGDDTDNSTRIRTASSIVLLEIAA